WDILEDYSFLYPQKIKPKVPLSKKVSEARVGVVPVVRLPTPMPEPVHRPKVEMADLAEDERVILKLLEGRVLTADDIIEKTDLPARQILSTLTMLQVKQLVVEEAGKRFTAL
ncbi:MAG: DNA-protecting protein DprA, partial [Evtepia sp.]